MTEEVKQEKVPSVAEMLRTTSTNNHALLLKIADKFEEMTAYIEQLERKILELEGEQNADSQPE